MNVIVQKFGGTSVGQKEKRQHAIAHIKTALNEGNKVVSVVSAMGRTPEPYATDTLLSLIDYPNGFQTDREYDLLLGCGEIISAVVFSNELKANGINATALTGAQAGFITDSQFTQAKIKSMDVERLKNELKTVDVVVVAGFQGQDENGDTTTLGRGGSDTSAAALGAALGAEYIDIFTDVDGVKTADPRVVEDARTIKVVTYNEISNLAYQGAKVVHPRAVELAMQAKVPIRVRSTVEEHVGTLVTSKIEDSQTKDVPDRLITGIAHIADLTQVSVESSDKAPINHSEIFTAMADHGISVDFINITPSGILYTIPQHFQEKVKRILLEMNYAPHFYQKCAKIALVGAGMTGVPGVTATIVQSLAQSGIPILQSADSHTTIWVLVEADKLKTAVNTLHRAFALNEL
ncbi:aspartate kinase [Pelagirhabdus alkalitolerans]|uniref:Aspartokinase n=1 Tax=Pelagirhabdus alkalitolerans TaxID=1612202 RepID=A0A1G6H4V9_9BACI|nr:aspartate kinase [Pelagirhabdus alkalitolerans]SDB89144.1 aspartate kinase [Pelagirhabdus alkalitolerans]